MIDFPWLIWVIVTPLLAACAMIVLRQWSAAIGVFCSLAISAAVAALGYQVARLGPQHMDVGGWSEPLGIRLHADGISVCLLGITALIGSFVSIYAAAYFQPRGVAAAPSSSPAAFFWLLWMFLWAALNALFLSADIFNVYVALEMLGLSSVALVALSNTPPAVSAAMRYLLVSLLGSLSYLMGVAFLYGAMGTLNVSSLAAALNPAPFSYAALALMSTGLLMKSALFPLHFWLPPAHENASAPVSALLSALVVKASFYILFRLWFGVFGNILTTEAGYIPGVLGAAAVFWGSIQALSAQRLKQLIAYSTVAQVGYLFLVFPLGMAAAPTSWTARSAAFFFVMAHACAKAAVFLSAGNVLQAFGHDRIEELRGSVQQLPISMFAFGIAGVSLIGLPPSGGFIAKWLYLNAALDGNHWGYVGVILAGGLLSTAYIFRFFSRAFSNVPERGASITVPRSMEWSAFALAMGAMAFGLTGSHVMDLLQAGIPITGSAWAGGRP